MPTLIPLHVKSHHSLGIGTASPERLVEAAAAAGLPALALTDLENLYGQVRFHDLCRRAGVRPITGVELRPGFEGRGEPGRREGRLVLLAAADEGYESLCRIVSRRRVRRGSTSPRATGEDPVESLRGRQEGLVVLTDDPATLRRALDSGAAARESAGLLLRRPSGSADEARLVEAAGELGVPLVADPDAVMAEPEEHPLHVLMAAIAADVDVRTVRRLGRAEDPERHLGDPAAAADRFRDRPGAVRATVRIAERCTLDLRAREPVPMPGSSPGRSAADELARRCRRALREGRRSGRFTGEAYDERLASELRVIRRLEVAPYFLTVAEIVEAAAARNILTAGRGSAAGSLTCHLLGVTQLDPVARGLYFERFLHERRPEPPDIDVDVDSRRRDELIEWIRGRYGRDRVAMVSAHVAFRRRSALREGLKALGLPAARVGRVLRRADRGAAGEDAVPSGGSDGDGRLEELLPDRFSRALPLIRRLEGTPRHLSVHPAGVVVAAGELRRVVPLERAPKGTVVTQFDQRSVEAAGLLKIDLLGNRALAEIDETIRLLGTDGAADGDRADRLAAEGPSAIPAEDPETLDRLDRADTLGCFQVESPAVRSVLRSVPVRGTGDLVAALAVVRPGAAAGRAKRAYVRRAGGLEPAEPLHPAFGDRLDATHGLPLFEEDILFLLHEAGGISLAEADELRTAILAAGEDDEALARLGERFLVSARESGHDEEAARAAWATARRFAAYSFSRAHAASYALLAYRTVFLRTHFPVEFGCAVLNHHAGMYPTRAVAAAIVRGGVPLLGPSVVRSERRAAVEREEGRAAVRLGLDALKRVRRRTVGAILRERPFGELGDLLDRVALSGAERRALLMSGACDGLAPLSDDRFPEVHRALLEGLQGDRSPRAFEAALSRAEARRAAADESASTRKWRRLVRIRSELVHLEMHPSGHPMEVLREDARREGCVPIADLRPATGGPVPASGATVRVAALLAAGRRLRTRGGERMRFLTLEDETGTQEAVLFPDAYRRMDTRVTTAGPYLVQGRLPTDEADPHLVISDIRPFKERLRRTGETPPATSSAR